MKLFILILFSFLFSFCGINEQTQNVHFAEKGVIDLRNFDFSASASVFSGISEKNSGGIVQLNGEWEFYWMQYSEDPEEQKRIFSQESKEYYRVPKAWTEYEKSGRRLLEKGYAIYRLKILLPEKPFPAALKINLIGSNYILFHNGKPVYRKGITGRNESESIPMMQISNVELEDFKSETELVFLVSNYNDIAAGIIRSISIGSQKEIFNLQKKNLIIEMIVFACLGIMGIYHLVIFSYRKKDRSPLYFGIFCLLIAVRVVCINEKYIFDIIPETYYLAVHKAEYISFYMSGAVFLMFLNELFREEILSAIQKTISKIQAVFSIIVLLTPMKIYAVYTLRPAQALTIAGIIYSVAVLVRAGIKRKEGAWLFLSGIIIFFLFIINDIMYSFGVLRTGTFANYGLLVFILVQAVLLSQRFSRSFLMSEKLSEQLTDLNQYLEEKVELRTRHLEEARQAAERERLKSEKLAESRKSLSIVGQMAAGVVHDIKNSIMTIKSYSEAANSSEISEDERKKDLEIIIREIDKLGDMAYEILDFARGDIRLFKTEVRVSEFLNEIKDVLYPDFEYCGIRLDVVTEADSVILIDRGRMRRVLINLANNAREAMSENRNDYRLQIRSEISDGKVRIVLSDNGTGISPQIQDRLFDIFITEGKTKGTGLGLFMCRWVVELHEGTISFSTEFGKGTEFIITL
ncbi:MAG TPA: sensor histidine kinase [Leptospiraceae bacterium]|nr:sensor histidine kinase [Leptospiraceae bacterium]